MPAAIPAITAVSAIAGTGMALFGAHQQSSAASNMASSNQQIIAQEQAAEAQRQQAMELDARRRQMEQIRQGNVARATALSAATADGAAQGSGLQGAYGNISGQIGNNMLGVNQNLQIGRNIFGIDSSISSLRQQYAGYQGDLMQGAAMTSLGGQMVQLGPTVGRIGATFGGMFGGGSGLPSRGGMELNY